MFCTFTSGSLVRHSQSGNFVSSYMVSLFEVLQFHVRHFLLPYTFSALTLLVGRQEGHPACKNWVVGCWHGYLSGSSADLHMARRMPLLLTISCFSKIQIGFFFLVLAHPGSPGKRAVKRVCVCVSFSAPFAPPCEYEWTAWRRCVFVTGTCAGRCSSVRHRTVHVWCDQRGRQPASWILTAGN